MRKTYPKSARLLHRAEFQRVYRLGRQHRHPQVVLFHTASGIGPTAPARFGITVSRRVSKRAVKRNRIRRVWQEAARLQRERFRPGIDIVLNSRQPDTWTLKTPEAERILLELGGEAGLLHPPDSD